MWFGNPKSITQNSPANREWTPMHANACVNILIASDSRLFEVFDLIIMARTFAEHLCELQA